MKMNMNWRTGFLVAIWFLVGGIIFAITKDWEIVAAIGTWLLAGGIAFAIVQVQQGRKSTNIQTTVGLFRDFRSDDEVERLRLVYALKPGNFKNLGDSERKVIGHVCDMHDMLGALVVSEIIDERLAIEAFAGRPALRCWYKLCKYIRELQKDRGYYAEWYEAFARLCLDHFKKVHLQVNLDGIDVLTELQKDEFHPRSFSEIQKDRKDKAKQKAKEAKRAKKLETKAKKKYKSKLQNN